MVHCAVQTIPISKFKATCLAVLERVRRTGKPVLVTRFGKPVAEIVAPAPGAKGRPWIGSLQGRGRVEGDIVSPAVGEETWEALRS